MERHQYIRPSNAASWSSCTGYAYMNEQVDAELVEERDNEVREDGTACHWLAYEVWKGSQVALGSLSPNNREITEEMFYGVAEYHAMIRSWPVNEDAIILEEKVSCSTVFPGVADGTPDVRAWDDNITTLYLGDLKFGFRPVDVWRCAQLVIYAYTLMCIAMRQGYAPQWAELFICQPRVAHPDGTVRKWRVHITELGELAEKLAAAAQACYAPCPPCKINPGCGDCGAAFGCRTLQAGGLGAADVSYDATPFVLTEAQLGYELSKLNAAQKRIEDRINGLSTQAENLMRKGKAVPGFEMSRAGTRWRWRQGSENAVALLAPLLGVEAMEEPKIKTVAKLRDKLPDVMVAMYAEKPLGELKLKQTDPNQALRAFSKK